MMPYTSRSRVNSAISVGAKIAAIALVMFIVTGCSSRPLNQTPPDRVRADLMVDQAQDHLQVAVTLRTPGQRAWLKPEPGTLSILDGSGQRHWPSPPNRRGVSYFHLQPNQGPFELQVLDIIQQPIPILLTPKVVLYAPARTPWHLSDSVRLQIMHAAELQHFAQWILRCGSEEWRIQAQLTPLQTHIDINLSTLWQQFEHNLGARITGVAELDLEIFYEPQIESVSAVNIVQWRQLWRQQSQLQSPRSAAQLSGGIRLGTPNISLGVQSTPVKACR